jgi:hypothetical protein
MLARRESKALCIEQCAPVVSFTHDGGRRLPGNPRRSHLGTDDRALSIVMRYRARIISGFRLPCCAFQAANGVFS